MTYEIGECTVDGNKAEVEIKINTVDLPAVIVNYTVDALLHAYDNKEWNTDEAELINVLSAEDAPRKDFTATVNLTKTDNGWIIDDENDEFFNALTGGLVDLIKTFQQPLGSEN